MASFSNFKNTQLTNIGFSGGGGLDSASVNSLITASVPDPTTLTKTFADSEQYNLTLATAISNPTVNGLIEVPAADQTTKGSWNVDATGSNYTLQDYSTNTTITPEYEGYGIRNPYISYDNKKFDINTATSVGLFKRFKFKPDGTKLFAQRPSDDKIYEIDLSTAWDISTASYNSVYFASTSEDAGPVDFDITSDGTQMIVWGNSTDKVYLYDLGTAWDMSTVTYSGNSYQLTVSGTVQVNLEALQLNHDDTQLLVVQGAAMYYATLSTAGDFSTLDTALVQVGSNYWGSANGWNRYEGSTNDPYGAVAPAEGRIGWTHDGSAIWHMNGSAVAINGGAIYLYDASTPGDLSTIGTGTDPSYQTDNFFWYGGIFTEAKNYGSNTLAYDTAMSNMSMFWGDNGKKFYLYDHASSYIYQFTSVKPKLTLGSGSFSSNDVGKRIIGGGGDVTLTDSDGHFFASRSDFALYDTSIASGNWSMHAINYDSNGNGLLLNKYLYDTVDGILDGHIGLLDTSAEIVHAREIRFGDSGRKLYVLDFTTDAIYQYNLTIPYSVSSGSYASKSLSVITYEGTPFGFDFNSDGTQLYVIGIGTDDIDMYTLSTAWDISTATYSSSSATLGTLNPYGTLQFSDDGTYVFTIGTTSYIERRTLSTAYDISTMNAAADTGQQLSMVGFLASGGLWFKIFDSGKKIVFMSDTADRFGYVELSTAWDLSDVKLIDWINLADVRTLGHGVEMSPDGKRIYISDEIDDNVKEFNFGNIYVPDLIYSTAMTDSGGQIDTSSWGDLNSMTPDQQAGTNTAVYYSVSTDGRTSFKVGNDALGIRTIVKDSAGTIYYNNDSTFSGESFISSGYTDMPSSLSKAIEANTANQMDASTLASISDANHFTLGDTLDLAMTFYTSDNDSAPISDAVTIGYSANATDYGAVLGTDYNYEALTTTKVRFTAIRGGNYKFKVS